MTQDEFVERAMEVLKAAQLEELADVQHEIWSHWMKYMFSVCVEEPDILKSAYIDATTGALIIPKEKVERWKRQMNTPYCDLTEKEKESDREQVRKFTHLI